VLLSAVGSYALDPLYLVPGRSTRSFEALTPSSTGYYIYKTTQVSAQGDPTDNANWETISHDRIHYLSGHNIDNYSPITGAYSEQGWALDHKLSDVGVDGTTVTYSYDSLNRLILTRKADVASSGSYPAQGALYTHFTYDAAGRVLSQRASSSSNPTTAGVTTSATYDLAGRIKTSTDADGLVTNYAYDTANRTATVTLPGGFTKITESYRDGSVKKITGTGVVPAFSETIVNSGGTLTTKNYSLRSSDLSSPTSAPRWSAATTD
jgi:YD repeat-containing protein